MAKSEEQKAAEKAEKEAKAKAEKEAKEKADQEAKAKAAAEAKAKADPEAERLKRSFIFPEDKEGGFKHGEFRPLDPITDTPSEKVKAQLDELGLSPKDARKLRVEQLNAIEAYRDHFQFISRASGQMVKLVDEQIIPGTNPPRETPGFILKFQEYPGELWDNKVGFCSILDHQLVADGTFDPFHILLLTQQCKMAQDRRIYAYLDVKERWMEEALARERRRKLDEELEERHGDRLARVANDERWQSIASEAGVQPRGVPIAT